MNYMIDRRIRGLDSSNTAAGRMHGGAFALKSLMSLHVKWYFIQSNTNNSF